MKRLLQILLLLAFLAPFSANAANTYYITGCGPLADAACAANEGADSYNGLSRYPGFLDDGVTVNASYGPWQTCAKVKSTFNATAADTQFKFAKGGHWAVCDLAFTGAPNSATTGRDHPIIFDSWTPAWGAGATPLLQNTTTLFGLQDSGNVDHDEGYIIRNLHLKGTKMSGFGIVLGSDVDYVTIDNVEIDGFSNGVYCIGGSTNALNALSDGISEYITLKNSNIHDNSGNGTLWACRNALIENNTFSGNGTTVGDHNIYFSHYEVNGTAYQMVGTIIRGNTLLDNTPWKTLSGVTMTSANPGVVTWASHALIANQPIFFTTTGALPTNIVALTTYYVVGASITTNTFQLSATPGGAAIDTTLGTQSGTHTAWAKVAGGCKSVALVGHGTHDGITITNNILKETTVPASGACYGIELNSGYIIALDSPTLPSAEYLYNVTIAGNTVINSGYVGIALSICQRCLVENNYIYSDYTAGAGGIWMRADSEGVLESNDAVPKYNTIRNNSAYLKGQAAVIPYRFTFRPQDPGGSTGHVFVNNLAYITSGTSASTACFHSTATTGTTVTISNQASAEITLTANNMVVGTPFKLTTTGTLPSGFVASTIYYLKAINTADKFTASLTPGGAAIDTSSAGSGTHTLSAAMPASAFTAKDYNLCYFAGTAGVWDNFWGSLAATQSATGFETHSVGVSSDPTITTPASGNNWSLAIPASGPAYNTGDPTNSSAFSIFNRVRATAGTKSIGAFEPGTSSDAAPLPPTRPKVQ